MDLVIISLLFELHFLEEKQGLWSKISNSVGNGRPDGLRLTSLWTVSVLLTNCRLQRRHLRQTRSDLIHGTLSFVTIHIDRRLSRGMRCYVRLGKRTLNIILYLNFYSIDIVLQHTAFTVSSNCIRLTLTYSKAYGTWCIPASRILFIAACRRWISSTNWPIWRREKDLETAGIIRDVQFSWEISEIV